MRRHGIEDDNLLTKSLQGQRLPCAQRGHVRALRHAVRHGRGDQNRTAFGFDGRRDYGAIGSVTNSSASYSYAGGLVGGNEGAIQGSFATGTVSGNHGVGGLVPPAPKVANPPAGFSGKIEE